MQSQRRVRRNQFIAVLTVAILAVAYLAFEQQLPASRASLSRFVPGLTRTPDARQPLSRDLPRGHRSENTRRLAANSGENLQPGSTTAELCASTDDGAYHCESGSYDGSFRPTARGARAPSEDSSQGRSIAGRVLAADGTGLAGIALVAAPGRMPGAEPAAETLRFWTVTDSSGAYAFVGLPEGEYAIRSRAHGEYPSARLSARTGAAGADLVITPRLAATAEGRVLDADGSPLPGVIVAPQLTGQASVETDEEGRFSVPVTVKPGVRGFSMRFQRPGFREATGEFDLASAAALEVVMHPVEVWTSVKGRLRDADGPLAGRTIELRPVSGAAYTATTDEDGRFAFPALEAPADFRLTAFGGAGHEDREEALHVTADARELDLVAAAYRTGTIAGRVTNLDGEPVADFELALRNVASRHPNVVVRTDDDGRFAIADAPAGRLTLASPSAPAILADGIELAPGATLELPLVVDVGAHEIHGQVVDARGAPVTASRIVMQWSREAGGVTTRITRRAAADAEGRFSFTRLGPGPHALAIDAPGFPAVTVEHDVGRGYDLRVQLKTNQAALAANE